ncbi:MAG: hypothetical protein IPL07_15790 [Acidimicrobiaceae bacterium]|nr:hypothetical protein [Acidimicrobiaceae bacterium]
MVARGSVSGVLHADDITRVLRHIELTHDVLVDVHATLAALGIAVDDGMAELHDDTPVTGVERPRSVEVEDTEGLLARRIRRRSERMNADRSEVGNTADTRTHVPKGDRKASICSPSTTSAAGTGDRQGNRAAVMLDAEHDGTFIDPVDHRRMMRTVTAGQRAKASSSRRTCG